MCLERALWISLREAIQAIIFVILEKFMSIRDGEFPTNVCMTLSKPVHLPNSVLHWVLSVLAGIQIKKDPSNVSYFQNDADARILIFIWIVQISDY